MPRRCFIKLSCRHHSIAIFISEELKSLHTSEKQYSYIRHFNTYTSLEMSKFTFIIAVV